MNAIAFMFAYNEADIIGWTVRDMMFQGVEVHVIDNWSTDGTAEAALKVGATVERYPDRPVKEMPLRSLLQWVEKRVSEDKHDWCVYFDADEMRRSPVPGETLLTAFERVSSLGYNAVNHQVLTFHPINNGYMGVQNPETYFKHYSRDGFNERIGQIKAWSNSGPIEIAAYGGHRIRYNSGAPLNVYPVPFLNKHYPIRSQGHGERKVFCDRRGRWADPEKSWHVQYKDIGADHNFLKDPATLEVWQ